MPAFPRRLTMPATKMNAPGEKALIRPRVVSTEPASVGVDAVANALTVAWSAAAYSLGSVTLTVLRQVRS